MNEQLRLLVELQRLDTSILTDRMMIDAMPARISSKEGPLKSAEAAYESAKQRQASLEKKKKDKERAIEDTKEKINKLRQRTSEVKTNKEYQAHLKEIEAAEKEIRGSEDEILSVMESLEESSRLLKAEESRIAEEKRKVDALRKELEGEISRCEEELKKLKGKRKGFVAGIEDDIYRQYMTLMKTHRGLAVVEAKNEICQGCNIHIPPQLFVELKKNEEITHCPQCRRILYYVAPEENNAQPEAGDGKAASAKESAQKSE